MKNLLGSNPPMNVDLFTESAQLMARGCRINTVKAIGDCRGHQCPVLIDGGFHHSPLYLGQFLFDFAKAEFKHAIDNIKTPTFDLGIACLLV
ncbi:hypothetical protein EI77_04551 [Prosthecobacter fusiformis]|uniref:Uncharacterized protein n=1 Tax=Prosthecobacter fusiformis TaxID=48464 RepID=A0A4V3FDY9_9BACT|nr:hypothetical protein EI77_04551 [Prosthecobacter fusiformis]